MKTILLVTIFACWSSYAIAESAVGIVIGITDGDTVSILTAKPEQVTVRLAEIDAPEMRQPYGQKAKSALSDLIYDKKVVLEWTENDRYGRAIGKIYLGEESINFKMVATGNAWVYRKYSNDNLLLKLEASARAQKKGLWALQADQIMPPWEWRKKGKK